MVDHLASKLGEQIRGAKKEMSTAALKVWSEETQTVGTRKLAFSTSCFIFMVAKTKIIVSTHPETSLLIFEVLQDLFFSSINCL